MGEPCVIENTKNGSDLFTNCSAGYNGLRVSEQVYTWKEADQLCKVSSNNCTHISYAHSNPSETYLVASPLMQFPGWTSCGIPQMLDTDEGDNISSSLKTAVGIFIAVL